MLSFSWDYFEKLKEKLGDEGERVSFQDVTGRFKVSLKDIRANSLQEISVVSEQIY